MGLTMGIHLLSATELSCSGLSHSEKDKSPASQGFNWAHVSFSGFRVFFEGKVAFEHLIPSLGGISAVLPRC